MAAEVNEGLIVLRGPIQVRAILTDSSMSMQIDACDSESIRRGGLDYRSLPAEAERASSWDENGMNNTLRVLIVEDSESDTGLIVRKLERAGYELAHNRVETPAEMKTALEREEWDLVISDHSMPRFDAIEALKLLQASGRDIPFIVLSGTMGEDAAVAIMKAGANDYVMKDNLARLIPAVRRELADAEVRRKRKQVEEALRQTQERYRALYEDNPSMYITVDAQGTVLSANRFAAEEMGYRVGELVGQPVLNICHPDDRQSVRTQFSECLENPEEVVHWESRKVRKDGSIFWVKQSARAVRGSDGDLVVLVVCEDITERKKAEEERIRLVTAIEQSAEAIFTVDTGFIIQYANPAFEHMSGYAKNEIIGQHTRILKSDKHGSELYRKIRESLISTGEVWSGRLTIKRKDGTFYEAEATASPVRDSLGAIINYTIIHRDITHETRLERELRQAQKMEAIGTLAGGIAHDFNNILTAIIGFTDIALSRAPEDSPLRRNLEQVLKAGSRATDLVKQILTFSRQTEQERKPLQIAPIVKEALKLLRSSLPSTIEIRYDFSIGLDGGIVMADPTQIHQVLMNLCTNAAHAMRTHGGVLSVTLSDIEVDPPLVSLLPDLQVGPYVRLTVSDTGHGMDSLTIERIFDPYFTTKGVGEGTGLGLSVVQGIVKSYGGAISVYSEPDKGTTFNVLLPRIEEELIPENGAAAVLQTGNERILFIDDEKTLVDLAKEMLKSLGYNVSTSTNSLEALETFRTQPDAYDLVITDMTMPGLTGRELAKEIMAIRPHIPIILCTGFSELINEKQAKEAGIRKFLMKPYVLNDLAKIIRNVLDEKR